MNEHFKKHLEASYTRAFEECARTGHRVGDLDAIFNSIAMATFAELIVKEAFEVIVKSQRGHMNPKTARDAIKEHFGVEENLVCQHDWYSARNPVVLNGSICVICNAIDPREPDELRKL